MAYKICVKPSFRSQQLLAITQYDVLNFVLTDSGSLQFRRPHKQIGQLPAYSKRLVSFVFIRKTVHNGGIVEFAELSKIPQHLIQPYYGSLVS